ncbi:hypothetical protein ACF0H5_016673 [Mactra antiquata]
MCIPFLGCIVDFLPYFCIVTIPFFGSFGGIDLSLRLSLLIYVYTFISEVIPRSLHYVIPYLNLCILTLLIIYVPLGVFPWPVIWLYDKILWLSEPVLLTVEIVLILNYVMHCSRRCAENIEESEEDAWKWKCLLTVFSAACYALLAILVMVVYKEGSNVQFWFVLFVLCFSVLLAAHNMMWMSQEGIISDVAFVTLSSVVILYTMKEEITISNHPLTKPTAWYRYHIKSSIIEEVNYIIHTSVENGRYAMNYLLKFLNPLFLMLLGIRLYSILYVIQRIVKKFGFEEEETDLEEFLSLESSPWRSTLSVKCSMIFMLTQYTIRFYYQCSGMTVLPVQWNNIINMVLPHDVLLGRILQIIVLNSFYIWRLYCSDEWQWNYWFCTSV